MIVIDSKFRLITNIEIICNILYYKVLDTLKYFHAFNPCELPECIMFKSTLPYLLNSTLSSCHSRKQNMAAKEVSKLIFTFLGGNNYNIFQLLSL